ncbi:UDP-N-acetyl-D-glucosamine dehydrogenase [Meinhardsimonia xiamenensis]|jgi:UDP-N-acetyl-D-glucosamine dehydrogenase|uniref:UDP-N-acetyl-D-glucosamine dehydrogenase n=1 Tax=Meinhardsimonia xiamenensis TaxID=990712 RepID=A0A1G9HKB5_9RHOB|nr:nucleotide sugar dehydrogenase [Meinhardsimonia xiamenensis]PRX27671.1 UDP-N-acetyl-D-glucosamine dehydrogenase [Meinhardsimonia xiamenensis]SDL13206.1 UDP-N-acetyl-D-glucosamine dehydrogenase [Meinhardsimonia xiamenensis]
MRFVDAVASRSAKIGILGLGYVGIPLALRISEVGLGVVGFDVDAQRVDELNAGQSPIRHIPREAIAAMRAGGFEATGDFSRAAECDALIICVPTPLNTYREPDLSFVTATMEQIAPHLRKGQLISLESTTWPGTTDEVLKPFLDRAGLRVGEDAYLVYSPEREDPGNAHFNTRTIPKVVGGHTPACLAAGEALYGAFIDRVVPVSSTRAAEMVKLLENIHRSINIGLVNEMKVVADAMGLDIFEIIDAAATKPFGFTPYYPGPGIGGHCIPIDPFYLTWKAREYGLHTRFIELAGEINASMPQYVVDKTVRALNEAGKAVKGAKILALGIAYKRDVDDMRESPSVFVMEILRDWGAELSYADPNVPVFPKMREHHFDLASVELTPELLAAQDAVILLTDHSAFDYDMIREHAPLIIDTRGRFRGAPNAVRA